MNFEKLIAIILIIMLVSAALVGCTFGKDDGDSDIPLGEIVEQLVAEADCPMYEVVPLDETTFEFATFIPYADGLSAVQADALVNITPHSLVVIKVDDGNAADLANDVFKNANPNKWLCVGSDIVKVANSDHYVVLVMSFEDIADAVVKNFETVAANLNDGGVTVQSRENTIRYN